LLRQDGRVSPRRRLLLLAALAAVLVGVTVVGVRFVAGRVRENTVDRSRPGTVLLVPGYGGSPTGLNRLADRLRAAGRTAVVVVPPGDGTGDLRTQADVLDTAVRKAVRDGAPSVDVVGYSAGGVVTRQWVAAHGGAKYARRIVTLGSPLHGAQVAAAGSALAPDVCPVACQQLAPGSGLLATLDAAPLPAGLPWLSIWTENDETVRPPDSARLDGAVNVSMQSLCPQARIAHAQLPTDPQVTALVLRALGDPQPLSTPPDCAALGS
jgi:triacylglycerol lipase